VDKLVFVTQRIDPADPVLGATVGKVCALAALVDDVVVLCDSAVPGVLPENCRVRTFGSALRVGRGARFETALVRELRPRPDAVVAHMVPLYALLAAPLVRPFGIRLLLWFTHWKNSPKLRLAERVSTAVVTVDSRSFPFASRKVQAIGHGIDVSEFECSDAPAEPPLRTVALGRYSPAKGLEHVLRGVRLAADAGLDVRLTLHGTTGTRLETEHKRRLAELVGELRLEHLVELGGPVPRPQVPAVLAASHVLVNNMEAGAPDKVVYEAAASCLPVLASNPVFDELLPPELRFERDRPDTLAEKLLTLDRRRRPELRRLVVERHSVESWARGILEAAR
jgi:glycosyltransferase involved in cell wall biosynthesis